jgi:aspartate kinase
MKVLKFGGTSVGSPDRIKKLLDIINPKDRQIVVLSAVSGTTNSLLEISQAYLGTEKQKATELIKALKDKYEIFIKELFASAEGFEQGKANLSANFLQYLSKAANSAQATSIFLTKVSFSSEALSMPSQQKPL